MKENELQKELFEIIENGNLYNYISNIESIEQPLKQDEAENYIPNFSIDYLLKYRYCYSANEVIKMLSGDLEIINGKKIRSISLKKNERLYPDFVLINNETEQIIIIELKRDSGAEREAITELIAYAQEMKNHLPFLSNYDYSFIIISTEFETLLRHSVGSLILDTTLNILCLKPNIEESEVSSLEVVQPNSWTDLYCACLPSEALVSYTLVLYDYKDSLKNLGDGIYDLLEMAGDLITHYGNRHNSHGFYIIWRNMLNVGYSEYCITIYVINPYIFQKYLVGLSINETNPLLSKLWERNELFEYEYYSPQSIFRITDNARKLLEKYFDSTFEIPSTWHNDFNDSNLKIQKLPLLMDSWGTVGDFVRYFYLHPGVKNTYFRQPINGQLSYKNPVIGIQIINYMTGMTVFNNGNFCVKSFFLFGKNLALLIQISELREINSNYNLFESWLYWLNIYLIPAIKEIGFRYEESDSITVPPPTFKVHIYNETLRNIKLVEDYVLWINEHLLDFDSNGVYKLFFNLGFSEGLALENQYSNMILNSGNEDSIETINRMKKEIITLVRDWLNGILEDVFVKEIRYPPEETMKMIKFEYLHNIDFCNIKDKDISNIVADISDEFIIDTFETYFLELVDSITPPLFHEITPFDTHNYNGLDLDWIKEQILKRRQAGEEYVAIQIGEGGTISIIELPEEEVILGYSEEDDKNDMIYVRDLSAGFVTLKKISWQEVLDGNLFL
ncbi:hypothetical protein [Ectobacillus funiculus]|uniref:hypothetical protein n=1 Tax=Ectobacillus funiculus TaxID=137993 RepID=UPI00196A7D40|nr:hypothetical protein [Ectobacillus funiculus]